MSTWLCYTVSAADDDADPGTNGGKRTQDDSRYDLAA
jgi:hypothetical protein